jgi:hypothetical protein
MILTSARLVLYCTTIRLKNFNCRICIMSEIADLIVEEVEKKAEAKELRKNINALIEQTIEYKCVYESILEMDGVNVSDKAAKAQALKISYDHFKPKDDN